MLCLQLCFFIFLYFEFANELLLRKCHEINAQHTVQNHKPGYHNLMDQTIHILTFVLLLNVIHSGLLYLQIFEPIVFDIMSLTNSIIQTIILTNVNDISKASDIELAYKTHVTNAELQEDNHSYCIHVTHHQIATSHDMVIYGMSIYIQLCMAE